MWLRPILPLPWKLPTPACLTPRNFELVKQHRSQTVSFGLVSWRQLDSAGHFGSISDSFRYVDCFRGANGTGVHILASMEPIQERTPSQVASAMPPAAARDLLEWNPSGNLPEYLGRVLSARFVTAKLLNRDPDIRVTDDQPYNEYFFLRRSGLF